MTEIIRKNQSDSAEPKSKNDFIEHLEGLVKNRAALAHLRSGLRRKDSRSMEMYPIVGRFLAEKNPNRSYEKAVFIVAALFGYYSDAKTNIGNLGASLRKYQQETESKSIENRFVALLNAEAEELPNYLRQIIGLLKSAEKPIPVNWEQLFKDVQFWEANNDNSKYESVQKKWARSFWGNSNDKNNKNLQENSEGENQ